MGSNAHPRWMIAHEVSTSGQNPAYRQTRKSWRDLRVPPPVSAGGIRHLTGNMLCETEISRCGRSGRRVEFDASTNHGPSDLVPRSYADLSFTILGMLSLRIARRPGTCEMRATTRMASEAHKKVVGRT